MPVPVDHHARLREVARRLVAQEDPLQRLSPLGRLDLTHDHHGQRQRFGAVITSRLLRGHQLDRPGGDQHLGPPRRLPVACRDRHISAPQRLPVTCVPVQLAAAGDAVAQHRAEAVVLGPHDRVTGRFVFVCDIFKDISTSIADVDPQGALGGRADRLAAPLPEPALAGLTFTPGLAGLALADGVAASEDLVGQPEHGAGGGMDGQRVVALVATAVAVADLPQPGQ